jgi:hypothetical protein
MAQAPSRALLGAGVVVAIGALLILNSFMQRLDPKYQEQQAEAEAQKKQEEEQKQQQKLNASGPSSPNANKLVELGDDAIVGKKDGKPEIVIGYSWTPEVQADPSKIYNVIDMITKAAPQAKLHIVNADAHPGAPVGIYMSGRTVIPAQPDGTIPVSPMAIQAILGMSEGHGGYGPGGYGQGRMLPPPPP